MPGLISSALYIIVFGQALGNRIGTPIKGSSIGYLEFITPGLAMMSVINMAYQNSSSSIMQAKFLKFIEDILIAPLSGFEISMAFTIGGMIRGVINGILILLFSALLINYYLDDVENYKSSNSLETTVNEYTCQGLELDYSGVCWGFDFTWANKENSWTYRKARGNGARCLRKV